MEVVLKTYPGITFKKVENDGVFPVFVIGVSGEEPNSPSETI